MMTKPSVVFWIVAVIALLWNGFGVFDYAMTISQNEAYLAQYTAEQIAYWDELPGWRLVLWTLGVGSALLGSVTNLLRKRITVILWAMGPVIILAGAAHDVMIGGVEAMGGQLFYVSYGFLTTVQILFLLYALRQRNRGVYS
ncbi:MAG: hypothetical protein AAGH41_05705 [Pseudomonadota bacterium]